MTTTFTGICDALIDDLMANVPALTDVRVHRYAPWDPEQQVAPNGERHLAVYPAAEGAEDAVPLVTGPGGDMLVQVYRIVYWEGAGDESGRGIADEEAASDLLSLLEAVRTRLYDTDNLRIGGAEHLRYTGAGLPDRSSAVRWFMLGVQIRTSITVT